MSRRYPVYAAAEKLNAEDQKKRDDALAAVIASQGKKLQGVSHGQVERNEGHQEVVDVPRKRKVSAQKHAEA